MMSKAARCPVCGQPGSPDYRPFCSRRCADVDLGRWFGGNYRISGEPVQETDGEKAEINDETWLDLNSELR
ncbi:DNA gyrase inhibitor YacG [Acetobacter fabarum]|uniref:DNA gyrase inhibitor YacG n=1 Tax=Acetobacter fabarum TaxID=483199 RepID=UPI00312B3E61